MSDPNFLDADDPGQAVLNVLTSVSSIVGAQAVGSACISYIAIVMSAIPAEAFEGGLEALIADLRRGVDVYREKSSREMN